MNLKVASFMACAAVTLASCGSKYSSDASGSDSTVNAIDPAIQQALNEKDSLIALFNDISGDMIQLRQMESIIVVPGKMQSEEASAPSLRDDIHAIQLALQERRERLAELEKKLASQSGQNGQLQQMISNLKAQINQNEETINSLTQQLSEAKTTIAGLNNAVDSLNTSVATVTAERDNEQQKNQTLTDDLNRCYYAIGSGKELKAHKIIETGFLRKTKIMQGDYEMSYFTSADKRSLSNIPLYSKKASVKTNQPKDSYTIGTDASGNKVLNITNPQRFWNASNFLVVQTD